MLELDPDRVRRNVRKASTEDLLDRATIYRSEMEPQALEIIDAELIARGITVEQVEAHLQARTRSLSRADGSVIKCSFCWRPAVKRGWGWHRLYGTIPIFPRMFSWCDDHLPARMRKPT